jgi:hypothetical protein
MRFVAVLKKSAGAGSRLAEKSFRSRPVKCMSSDPLPLPEIWSDLPEGDAYENARAEFAANRRSGLVLIEYASGFAQSDPQPVVRPPQRAEQPAASERVPSLAPAALAKALADLTAIVTQAEALLRAQGTLRGDVHFAVERIHDVAMALRMRDVEPALCDTLDASVREVGDAIVRHEAAATGALSAAGLLRDVMRRIEDLAVVASRMIASEGEPLVRPWASESEAAIEVAAVMTEAEAEPSAPVVIEAEAATAMLSPLVTPTEAAIEASAPVVIEAEAATDMLAPLAAGTEAANEASAPVVVEVEAATDMLSPPAAETEAANEASARVASEASIEARADELSVGPEAEIAHRPQAEAADVPVTSPVIWSADKDQTRSLLYIASDAVAAGGVSGHETQTIAEPADDVALPAELPAAMALRPQQEHPQDSINVAAEMPEDKGEAAGAALAIEAARAAPVVEVASTMPVVETPSASSAIEAAAPVVPVTRGGREPTQLASSPSVGESVTVAAIKSRRPANDPFAALYGLSEEELIALFS